MGGDTPLVISAGLPNITGRTTGGFGGYLCEGAGGTGALYIAGKSGFATFADGVLNRNYIGFNASLSNAIYGNSDTVQPPALQLIPQIKF